MHPRLLLPRALSPRLASRAFSSHLRRPQAQAHPQGPPPHHQKEIPPPNIYRTHGRALLKSLTLAFLTYQVAYWAWLTFEIEGVRDAKNAEIEGLKAEVSLLEGGRGHR